jgi:hypothetical protein
MQPALDASSQAPLIAGAIEPRMDEPPAEAPEAGAPTEPVAEVSQTVARAAASPQEEDITTEAPALRRSSAGEAQRREGGLLFTLRRLVRPQAEREAESAPARTNEAPATSAAQDISVVAEPPITSPEFAVLPGVQHASREASAAQPTLEASPEEGGGLGRQEAALPAFRATESPDMTLRRSRTNPDATPRIEDESIEEVRPPTVARRRLRSRRARSAAGLARQSRWRTPAHPEALA